MHPLQSHKFSGIVPNVNFVYDNELRVLFTTLRMFLNCTLCDCKGCILDIFDVKNIYAVSQGKNFLQDLGH